MDLVLLIIDCWMMLLIWLVQFIIYPAFRYMSADKLVNWHATYTKRIFLFVFPLMILQLIGHVWQLYDSTTPVHFVMVTLILNSWIVTFIKEVPTHSQISGGQATDDDLISLIQWNWPRTISWTLLAMINYILYTT